MGGLTLLVGMVMAVAAASAPDEAVKADYPRANNNEDVNQQNDDNEIKSLQFH